VDTELNRPKITIVPDRVEEPVDIVTPVVPPRSGPSVMSAGSTASSPYKIRTEIVLKLSFIGFCILVAVIFAMATSIPSPQHSVIRSSKRHKKPPVQSVPQEPATAGPIGHGPVQTPETH